MGTQPKLGVGPCCCSCCFNLSPRPFCSDACRKKNLADALYWYSARLDGTDFEVVRSSSLSLEDQTKRVQDEIYRLVLLALERDVDFSQLVGMSTRLTILLAMSKMPR